MVEILPKGFNDLYLSKYDEHLVLEKGFLLAKNIIFGGLFVDSVGQNVMLNPKTKSKLVVNFYEKVNDQENTRQHGTVYDEEGKARYEVSGSYLDEYYLLNLETGEKEQIWQEPSMMPNAHMQFYFDAMTILLNARTDGMEGTIAPTDTRFRRDAQLYEQGLIEEAEAEKIEIEQQQRR